MTFIDKARRSLLSALTIAMLASCGPRGGEPQQPAAPSAPFKQATAPDLSSAKGGDPVGALPSVVISGEVAAFKATSTGAGTRKNRDPTGSLPSIVTAGKSAVYAPEGAQEPSASGTPPARLARQ